MTTPVLTPAPIATIATDGPFAIPHPYDEGAIAAFVRQGGVQTRLAADQFSVAPAASATGGALFLTAAAAEEWAGAQLVIMRETDVPQDWAGTQAREVGLERQLDRITRRVQELEKLVAAAALVTTPQEMQITLPDSAYTLDSAGRFRLRPIGSFPPGPEGPQGPIPFPDWDGPVLQWLDPRDMTLLGDAADLRGPPPEHRWQTTALQFRQPGGAWGSLVDLKGDPGNFVGLNLEGAVDDPADLPAVADEGAQWGVRDLDAGLLYIYIRQGGAWWNLGPVTLQTDAGVANTIHVQEFGSNANSGTSWGTAVRSIERALELASLREEPTLILWAPEAEVITQGHLDMPDNCVIKATHRTVFIRPEPGFEERNVFRMGSGCFIEGMMFEGWRVDSLTDPTEGFAVSFRPGAVIRRVPYAHKIAVRSIPSWGLVPPPLDAAAGNPLVPRGGGVVLADGAVCSQYSLFPNIMTWGATPVSPNGIGYCAKRGGLVNAVNAVSMWAHKHFMALSGGQCILSSCSTQFGDFTMHSDGWREIVQPAASAVAPTMQAAAGAAIVPATAPIVDAMWAALVAGGYTAGWTASDETFTRSDAAIFLQSVAWVLQSGSETPMENFARGLFDTMGQPVFAADKLDAFTFSFEHMRDSINALPGVDAPAQALVTALVAALNATLTAPVRRREPSRISAIGHTWTATMAGVALTKIPPAEPAAAIEDSILETNQGVVVATGQDDYGNALLARGPNGTLEVDADFGLTGQLFTAAVRRRATKAAIIGSF